MGGKNDIVLPGIWRKRDIIFFAMFSGGAGGANPQDPLEDTAQDGKPSGTRTAGTP